MRIVAFTMLCLVLVTGCSSCGGVVLDQATQFQEMAQDIDIGEGAHVSIEEALEHFGVDGATVVVIEDGSSVLLRGHYGYQDKDAGIETSDQTIYRAASLTKFIAGLGMVRAAELEGGPSLGRKAYKTAQAHPNSLVSEWVNGQIGLSGVAGLGYTQDTSVRRLLNNTAGLNLGTTGTECARPSQKTGLDDILSPTDCTQCLVFLSQPGNEWKYSSGGFALAEAMLLAQSGRSAEEFLTTEILEPYGMHRSTFADASSDMEDLAWGGSACTDDVDYSEVKFPGGLLADPLEYATFLTYVLNDGVDAEGDTVIASAHLHEALTPAKHATRSTNRSCTVDSDCTQIFFVDEICHTGTCIDPLEAQKKTDACSQADGWYGLGVHMSPDRDAGGYSRILSHCGGHPDPKASSMFNIDRVLQNGIVIMMNGGTKNGRNDFRDAVFEAFERYYR